MSGTISLEATQVSVPETAGILNVAIVRTGDLSAPVTIQYEVAAVDASIDDFVPEFQNVVMPAGVDRILVPVTILDDALSEPTETINVSIISVDSGTLLFPRTTRIDILDDENPTIDPPQPPLVSDYDVTETTLITDLGKPIAIEFSETIPDVMFVAGQRGIVRAYDPETGAEVAEILDITAKTNSFGDRGLLDIALHPDLETNPYLYVFTVIDPPETATATDPNAQADGAGNRYAQVLRYELDADAGYLEIVPGSETVLLGAAGTSLDDISGQGALNSNEVENVDLRASDVDPVTGEYRQDYIKVDATSHAGGALEFGPDGALYVSIGDGTSFNLADPRTISVQSVDALAGKILRVDPLTGDGLADNPFVDEAGGDLTQNAAKVYQMGFRNPFSMSFDVEGKLVVANTGWTDWESIFIGPPGANFGWPFYEGGDSGELIVSNRYRDLPEADAFFAAVDAGEIVITPPYRAFAHDETLPGFQVQAITGSDDIILSDKYPDSLQGHYIFTDVVQGEIYSVSTDDRRDVRFLYQTDLPFAPVHFQTGPDGYIYYADVVTNTVGRLEITEKFGPDLLVNGAVEDALSSGSITASLTGWSSAAGAVEIFASGGDVDGIDNGDFIDLDIRPRDTDSLFQDVTTEADVEYRLTVNSRQRDADYAETINIFWNGDLVGVLIPGSEDSWESTTITVTGTGGLDRLEFRELPSDNIGFRTIEGASYTSGVLLDEISLRKVFADTLSSTGALLEGDDTPNLLSGGALDDTIRGFEEDDTLNGGDGDDLIEGGGFDDVDIINGEGGDDILYLAALESNAYGRGTINGGDGDDTIIGTNGTSTLFGDDGNDLISGGDDWQSADTDWLYGGMGDDTLVSGQTDTPTPGSQARGDQLFGEDGDDRLLGGAADDYIEGGAGRDIAYGGAGDDTIRLGGPGNPFAREELAYGGTGDDSITGANGTSDLYGEDGDDTLSGGNDGSTSDLDRLFGGTGNDVLISGSTNTNPTSGGDELYGEDGNDLLTGGASMDLLVGGRGSDTINGGDGDDLIYLGRIERSPWGINEAYGDGGNDTIIGTNGDSTIEGGAGDDSLTGGFDWITADVDILRGGDGNDTLRSQQNDTPDAASQAKGDQLFGDADDDLLIGGKADDLLDGGTGNDTSSGGEGADVFVLSLGTDLIEDFTDGVDRLALGLSDLSTVSIAQAGDDVTVTIGTDVTTLADTDLADVTSADFLFDF